ncbi:MAG: outer membrane protein assembly factor BamE [Gemmataceae bacterium]|nr:outer membrane protein assembly factor BamE [Gemmataceae bacterium]MCI0743648.1 outer membrane protein assembly factor BamE [Gemmataceae bacterium]
MRWRYWLCAAFVLLIVAVFFVLWRRADHRINSDNFAKVQIGMTQSEVEEIFGCPPGDYDEVICLFPSKSNYYSEPWRSQQQRWGGRHGVYHVFFDADSRVCDKTGDFGMVVVPRQETLWQKLLAIFVR